MVKEFKIKQKNTAKSKSLFPLALSLSSLTTITGFLFFFPETFNTYLIYPFVYIHEYITVLIFGELGKNIFSEVKKTGEIINNMCNFISFFLFH